MKKEDKIIQLLKSAGALSAREITDKLYDRNKHQSIVFSKLQYMEAKGIISKDTATWPYHWSLSDNTHNHSFVTPADTNTPPIHDISDGKPIYRSMSIAPSKKTVALISCTGSKREGDGYSCEARLLYDTSPFFPTSLAYAEIIADYVYILSAEYHLVELDRTISWYNKTLNDFSSSEATAWGDTVIKQISERHDVLETDFVILAGEKYYRSIIKHLPHYKLPLRNADGFDKQKAEREALYMCARLHNLFNSLPRFNWDKINEVGFDSGIYIMFEKGETYYCMDRIVRVGTHNIDGRLLGRLNDHFVRGNKDGSIFRKNIGRAILNKDAHPYLDIWNMNTSKAEVRVRLGERFDPDFQKEIERQISEHIRENFSFVCFPVSSETERLRLEEGIIAALNKSADFVQSSEWRGKHSPENEIAQSGMWLKEGLDGTPLTDKEYARIEEYCKTTSFITCPDAYRVGRSEFALADNTTRTIYEMATITETSCLTDLDALKTEFHTAMVKQHQARIARGYDAKLIGASIINSGGYETARKFISKNPTTGFMNLVNRGLLDCSIEALVLHPKYTPLFSKQEREFCRALLESFGYTL